MFCSIPVIQSLGFEYVRERSIKTQGDDKTEVVVLEG